MKKIIIGISVVVIMAVSAFFYLENSNKNNSYSTPEEALSNVKNPKLGVLEIIDTKLYDDVAYVFYYSEVDETPMSYLAVGKMDKNKYGWRFDEIIGVGNIDDAGVASGKDDYIVGIASQKVDKVTFGSHEAVLIPIDRKGVNAFLFHGVESELMGQTDFEYFDKEGNELPY
jgi:uncharacterized protein YxeA